MLLDCCYGRDVPEGPNGLGPAIAVLRYARGWTQERLSDASGVPQGTLSKLESGVAEVSASQLAALAGALDALPDVLREESLTTAGGVSCIHHRRRRSRLTTAATRRVEALANLTSLTVSRLLGAAGQEAGRALPARQGRTPEDVALSLRVDLELGAEPLLGLPQLVESFGVPIVRRPLLGATTASLAVPQDGVSFRSPGRWPLILVNEPLAGDRDRFTIAHELGHILLHGIEVAVDDDDIEDEANRFAGELLLPAEALGAQVAGITESRFRDLLELKQYWRCSVAAIVEQGRRIGAIDPDSYKAIRIRITKMGWHKIEPGAFSRDSIGLVGSACRKLMGAGMDAADLARVGLVTDKLFDQIYRPLIDAADDRERCVR